MKRGNFKIYSSFASYVPNGADCFIILAWLIVGMLVGNLLTLAIGKIVPPEHALEYSTVISYPLLFIPAMIYTSIKSRMNALREGLSIPLDRNRFAPLGGVVCAVLAVLLTLALGIVADGANLILPEMPDFLKKLLESMTSGNFLINFLCVSIMAPFFEEWLCRGMILRGLLGHGMKPWLAILISAVFFGLIHANPWQAIPAIILGGAFGYVYYKTGSLKLTMLMHFTNNTLALILTRIPALKDMQTWKEVLGDRSYWICFAACILVSVLILNKFRKVNLD